MSQIEVAGKVFVIVGGTGGIGFSAARCLLQAGACVLATGLEVEPNHGYFDGYEDRSVVLVSEATKPESAENAIQTALDRWGGIDGLYHVAGGSGRSMGDGPLHDMTDTGWQYTLDLNLSSVFYSNRAAARYFLAHQKRGSILNLTSVLAYSPAPRYFATHAYAAAKAAMIGLVKSCAAYYAGHDIRFNALAPGLIETPMSKRAMHNREIMAYIAQKQPLDGGRVGCPTDLDSAALFLLSDQSRFITGQVIAIDGGWSVSEGTFIHIEQEQP